MVFYNMAENMPPRIYISAMETEVTGLPRFDPQAAELLASLSEVGYDVFWEKQWRDYTIIEQEIATCDALLAIVDTTWTSSTWMAMEVTWAIGHFSMVNPPSPLMKPIPIFIYPVSQDASERFPFNHHAPILLDRDASTAVNQIKLTLPLMAGIAD